MNMKPSTLPLSSFRLVLIFFLFIALPSMSQAYGEPGLSYNASAYGTYAFVGNTVKAGKTSLSSLGCGSQPSDHQANTAASANIAPLLSVGNISTTVDALNVNDGTATQATSTVNDISLLLGLIQVDSIRAVSQTTITSTGFSTSAAGSNFSKLKIGGLPLLKAPAPNTKVSLPGVGYVMLNEQIHSSATNTASLTVNMIDTCGCDTNEHTRNSQRY